MSFIFYIAVLLVLLGVFFIYTSLEVRKVSQGEGAAPQGQSPLFDEDIPAPAADSPSPSISGFVSGEADSSPIPADTVTDTDTSSKDFNGVLYVDEKGIVLPDSSAGILEESGAYDGFSRIGSGVAQVGADALSVRIERKFFRFDYHRIREIRLREGVAVVYLKGDSRGNIFIAENVLFARVLDESFSRYSQKG